MTPRPTIEVAVVMRRVPQNNRWQPWRWELADVVAQEEGFGRDPRLLRKEGDAEEWLHPGFEVVLYRDEAEGYYLNVTTPNPAWFVMWRLEDEAAKPEVVTLSYNEAARWLDAQETVEQVPAPPQVVDWMRAFADEHYVPEPRRRKRPDSFKPLTDRFGNPASITTEKK